MSENTAMVVILVVLILSLGSCFDRKLSRDHERTMYELQNEYKK